MALKIKIGKADYDALDESLKTLYVADGEGFKLDADYEDVTGLKAKRDELLREQIEFKKQLKQFEGLDPEAARVAIAAIDKAESDKLTAAGDIDKIKEQLEARHATDLQKERDATQVALDRANAIVGNLRREKIANLATAKGVLKERIKAAIAEGDLDAILDLNETDFSIRKKDGIGDAKEVDEIFDGLKTRSPWLFESDNATGSGASGSNGNGGNMAPRRLTQAEVNALNPQAKREFYDGVLTKGNEVTDH